MQAIILWMCLRSKSKFRHQFFTRLWIRHQKSIRCLGDLANLLQCYAPYRYRLTAILLLALAISDGFSWQMANHTETTWCRFEMFSTFCRLKLLNWIPTRLNDEYDNLASSALNSDADWYNRVCFLNCFEHLHSLNIESSPQVGDMNNGTEKKLCFSEEIWYNRCVKWF